jgi:hypothetical protein
MFALSFVLLPVGVTGIEMLREQVLLQRAQQYLTETLSAAQLGLNPDHLADGQPVLDQSRTITLISIRFRQNIPVMLKKSLVLDRVGISWHQIPYDPRHWMGSEQPTRLPVVTISATLITRQGNRILLQETIELLLD